MKHFISIEFILCFFFHIHALFSQQLDIRTYTTLDGLADNAISGFYEDHFGYFWIGTGRGLNRFDGVNFKKYGMQNGLTTLSASPEFEDRKGRMWFGTGKGMAELRNDSFYLYPYSDHLQITYLYQLYENPEGQIIANTLEGQYMFNETHWEPYSSVVIHKNEIIVNSVEVNGGEYFSTGYELFYKNKQGSVKSLWRHPADSPYFRDLHVFDNEVFVVNYEGLFKIDSVNHELMFPDELKGKRLLTYFKDSQNRWWIATRQNGILMLEERDGRIHVQDLPGPSDFAAGFYEDHEKQMWISSPNGVMKILPSSFSTIKIHEVKAGHHILNLIPYGDQQLLLSINDGLLILIKYNIEGKSNYQVMTEYFLDSRSDFVDNYATGQNGEMWLTTRESQLYLLRQNRLENKTHLVTDAGQQMVMDVACDPVSGEIAIAMDSILGIGNEHKLDTFFDANHSIIKYPRDIKYMEGNHLVIQAAGGDVFVYAPDKDDKNVFSKIPIPASVTRMIKLDNRKQLWINNVGENLFSYTISQISGIIPEQVIDEISDNISMQFYNFTFDHEGSIWCVTNRGIQQIYIDKVKRWQSREHVVYEISHSAYTDWYKLVESGNKIWVNLRDQLIYFDLKIPETPAKSGTVILEEVQLNNQRTSWKNFTDSLSGYFQIPKGLRLKYNQNTLTFVYNCPSPMENRGTTYSYRLLPGDSTWSHPSGNKSVSFSKLKPEEYTFQVRSRNTGVEWSDATLFSFSIQKPFWDTTAFRILLLVLVSSLVGWIFRIRLRQEKTKGEIKSQLLELEMRALRAQMNPHFIYNALNSIQSLVATNQTLSANKYISKFARLLRQVLENSKRSEIPLSQELESLRLYIDLEKLRLNEEVKFIEEVDESVTPERILIPPLILQPFVENALWHGLSAKEGEKRIELNITSDQGWIHFTITDNGIGRQKASMIKSSLTQHESTALQVTEQRLRDFNGTLSSNPLQIEDLFTPDGAPSGTRILLHVRKKSSIESSVR